MKYVAVVIALAVAFNAHDVLMQLPRESAQRTKLIPRGTRTDVWYPLTQREIADNWPFITTSRTDHP